MIPVVGKYIIAGISLALAASNLSSNFLVWAAFLSCMIVFVFPLLVLGMVTPNLIKYAVGDLNENGKVVGMIEALTTIGSIIGTFLPTFVTIPNIGTSWNFIIFAFILFIICFAYFFFMKRKRIVYSLFGILFMVGSILGSRIGGIAFWNTNTIYEGESIYNYLRVEEDEEQIFLSTNVLFGVQSVKMKEDGLTGAYYDYALAANSMILNDDSDIDILILGLGTGTFAYQSELYYDNVHVDGVEIDEKIVSLAYKYFDLPEDVNVYINDGRSFMASCKKKYDIIMVDAYQDITIPFQMYSIEFFSLVHNQLKDGGVMVVNMNLYTSNPGGINDYLCGTIRNIFDCAYGVMANSNYELFATKGFDPKDVLGTEINHITNTELKRQLKSIYNNLEEVEASNYILTDDKAPVEKLGMAVLDDMIMDTLEEYRKELRGKNLMEIIKALMNGELF
jgi:spermidine synthase